jgi:hypothetical protein
MAVGARMMTSNDIDVGRSTASAHHRAIEDQPRDGSSARLFAWVVRKLEGRSFGRPKFLTFTQCAEQSVG